MAAKSPEAPLSESARIAKERRRQALEEAKQRKASDVGLFGDIGVVHVPPPPEKEEPPHDERPSAEDVEIERAYQDASSPAVQEAAEPEEELTTAEELEAAHEALEDARAAQAGREAFVEYVLDPMAEALARELAEPAGPDKFPGEDGLHAPSAETLRRQIAEDAERAENDRLIASIEAVAASETSGDAPAAEPPSSPQPAGFSLFGHNLFGDEVKAKSTGPLSDRFKLPPFTVFDARQGAWRL